MRQDHCFFYFSNQQMTKHKITDLAFIHITKTAGTSIEEWGKSKGVLWGHKNYHFLNTFEKKKFKGRSSWHIPPKYFYVNPYAGKKTFTVVRNPYTRLVSEFYCPWTGHTTNYYLKVEHSKANFNIWIQHLMNLDNAVSALPQYHYLPVDHVLKFETLQNDFSHFIRLYSHTNDENFCTLKKYNSSSNKIFTVDDMSTETLLFINKKYKKDFDLFNYDMLV